MALRIVLFVVAALLLGAHFLRAGQWALVALCLATPLLFFWRRRWALLLLQAAAYLAAAIWLVLAWQLLDERLALGRPWLVAVAILAAVAAYTALAGALLGHRVLRQTYRN